MFKKLLLSAENVSISFGARTLFHIEKLKIYERDRIGLVGLNGSGKTTLLRLLSGEISPHEGEVKLYCTPAYFKQMSNGSKNKVDTQELSLWGVQNSIDRSTLSGGEDTRLHLAELFSTNSPLFLLDEPTSHLDKEGKEYLNFRLSSLDSFILVSHDRELINRQCNAVIEIESGEVRRFSGNYSSYLTQKKQAFNRANFEYEKYVDEMKRLTAVYNQKKEQARKAEKTPRDISKSEAKTRDFCSSRRSPKGKAKSIDRSAKNIKKRMEHMEIKERPQEPPKLRPIFILTDPPKNHIVMGSDNLSFSYPNGKEIFRNAAFHLQRDSHTVLLGENGSGKSTLIRLILENKFVRVVPKANIGYLRQDIFKLNYDYSVLQNVLATSVQPLNIVRTVLARLLFSAEDIKKPVSVLSGGERIRLDFARILVSNANVLVLDEPTNYLDIPSIEAIEKLLAEYEGTLLFTSHDIDFIKSIATSALLIRDKQIFQYSLDDHKIFNKLIINQQ